MKLISVIVVGAISCALGIRVPTSWTNKDIDDVRLNSDLNARPSLRQTRRPNHATKSKRQEFKPSMAMDDWKPIIPHYQSEKHVHREVGIPHPEDDIPTRPIYPGEGQWAKPYQKHRPYIPKKITKAPKVKKSRHRPDGYEVFDKNKKVFQRQRARFNDNVAKRFPVEDRQSSENSEEEDEVPEFVPMRLYSQVRRTESEDHLPTSNEDPRLREAIKDSKIQTVYTEEGYEDVGYDHAGHEKTAEENEGFHEFDKEIEKERHKDSEGAGSVKKPMTIKTEHLSKTEEVMEVKSEVKNNGTTRQKFVTIQPKDYQTVTNRTKRDVADVEVDTDFIDDIKHDLPTVPVKAQKPKYPYYSDPSINPDSPLRYAEDLNNIPKKSGDDLAFYNQANQIECEEVESDVNPVPDRITNADEDPDKLEEGTEEPKQRLRGLGDKIDCFKVKYFGENPLDNPLFKEEIGTVTPIFQKIHHENVAESSDVKVILPQNDSMISIITTPKYTIDLKPEHIYHQIKLLDYLPGTNGSNRVTKSLDANETLPESQALKYRRRRPRPRPYHVFDINKFLPKPNYNRILRPKPKKNYGEIQYKNDIKTSEQLNVFADVINTIKKSNRDQVLAASNHEIPVVEELDDDVYEVSTKRPRKRNKTKYNVVEEPEVVTKAPRYRNKVKYSVVEDAELSNHNEDIDTSNLEHLELLKIGVTSTTERNHRPNTRVISVSSSEEAAEEEDTTEKVVGLMPPTPLQKYKTIIKPKMNIFYVSGMKPPSESEKVYHYSDFKMIKPKIRIKRSAQRPGYAEVVRNRNRPIDVDDEEIVVVEDDDDYVPHRPKNYHYDEETGRIVYDKTEAPVVEEEVIEVTEAPVPKPTRRKPIKFEKPTGPSYIDFIKQLKSDSKYMEITDPPTTEKGAETTTTPTTTPVPVSTTPPAFLGFLNKLRNDSHYMHLPDKTTTKKTSTTTEEPIEEEEESQLENVQNSPGGQSISEKFQIFDINEYLPKIKNYTPSTSIDYSKYKTIARPTVRHKTEEETPQKTEEKPEATKPIVVPEIMMSESKMENSSIEVTTRRVRIKMRGTRRTTTTTTPRSSTSATTSPPLSTKPKRVYPRRRPTRIKLPSSADQTVDLQIQESTTEKILRRRHHQEIATLNKTRQFPRKIDVQVFQKYDKDQKHGGNLRKLEDKVQEKRMKEELYVLDPKLPKKINQLMEESVKEEDVVAVENEDSESEEYDPDLETSKVPVFVKDPDKRMYYYAPI